MVWSSGSMSLFLSAGDPQPAQGELTLAIAGSTGSGLFGGVPLVVCCGEDGNLQSGVLPLFLAGSPSATTTRNVNLFVAGAANSKDHSAPLFLCNTTQGAEASAPLFIAGEGITPGALAFDSSMNLFLRRNPAAAMPLYMQAPGTPQASGLDLFIGGFGAVASSVPLSIPSVVGVAASSVPLSICGW